MLMVTTGTVSSADSESLTLRLARHVTGLPFEAIPTEIVDLAKDHLVHHVGLGLAAASYPRAHRSGAVAAKLTARDGRHRVFGAGGRYGLLEAVFANSLLMGEVALDDFAQGGTHPGVLVFPPSLALPEMRRVRGRDLLTSVVIGYDVLVALARGTWTWGVGAPRRSGCVVGPLGVAAVTARMLELDMERTAHALGLAAHGAVGLIEGTTFARVLYPQITRNGVDAALLASVGFRSTPAVLEGPFGLYETYLGAVPSEVLDGVDGLGNDFGIVRAFRKRYPCSGLNVVPVQLMDDLVHTTGITIQDVSSIQLTLPEARRAREEDFDRNFRRYRDAHERRYLTRSASPRFLLVAWLYDRRLDPVRYRADLPGDFLDLLDRTCLRFVSGRPLRFARLTVVLNNDTRYVREGQIPSLTPPMDRREWMRKLLPSARGSDLDEFVALVKGLEHLEDASALWASLDRCATVVNRYEVARCAVPRTGPTASQRIATYTAGVLYEDLPTAVVERAKDLLVHHVGLALHGPTRSHPTGDGGEPGGFSIIGQGRSLGLLDAVFANSWNMQHLGLQDAMTGGVQPSAIIIPAALAITEDRTITGREFLVALAIGYDICLALASGTWSWQGPTARRPNSVFGSVAVACMSARLLGLDPVVTADAVGQACHLTMGLIEGHLEEAAVNAQLARNGIFAALLAEAGFPAADRMIEGRFGLYRSTLGVVPPGLDMALAGLGYRFGLADVTLSPHSIHPYDLVPVTLTRRLVARLSSEGDEGYSAEAILPRLRKERDLWHQARQDLSHDPVGQEISLRCRMARVLAGREPSGLREAGNDNVSAIEDRIVLTYGEGNDPYSCTVVVTTRLGRKVTLAGDRSQLPLWRIDRASLPDQLPGGSGARAEKFLELVDALEQVDDASSLLASVAGICE